MEIFLGSSKERLSQLDDICVWVEEAKHTPLPWKKAGRFPPGQQSFHTLYSISKRVQGAIFIFGEDDELWYRQDTVTPTVTSTEVKADQVDVIKQEAIKITRDNVMIEYGLFTGALGIERAIICLAGRPKRPSDLHGLNYIDLNAESAAKAEVKAWLNQLAQEYASLDAQKEREGRVDKKEKASEAEESEHKEAGGLTKIRGNPKKGCCSEPPLLTQREKEILIILREYGANDDFSLTCSEIKGYINEKKLSFELPRLDGTLSRLKYKRYIDREEGRKRAYYITENGWDWMESYDF